MRNGSNSGSFMPFMGLQKGIINKVEKKQGVYTLTVHLPFVDSKGDNDIPASITVPFAHEQAGMIVIPQKGSQVLVGFINGQMNLPVILGSLYNSKNKFPEREGNKGYDNTENEDVFMKFSTGLTVDINNKQNKSIVTIQTAKKHKIVLDDETETLKITEKNDKTALNMDFKGNKIEIKADNEIKLSIGTQTTLTLDKNNVKLESSNITITGKSKVDIQSQSTASFKGTASTKLG